MQSCKWFIKRIKCSEQIFLTGNDNIYTIGRGKENFIKCLSLYVSRKHCVIKQKAESLYILDLDSANGTFVNNTKIIPNRDIPLESGDVIGIGVSEMLGQDCYLFELFQLESNSRSHVSLPSSSDPVNVITDVIVLTDSEECPVEEPGIQEISSSILPRKEPDITLANYQKIHRLGEFRAEVVTESVSTKEQADIKITTFDEIPSKRVVCRSQAVTSKPVTKDQPTNLEKTSGENEISTSKEVLSNLITEDEPNITMVNFEETPVESEVVFEETPVESEVVFEETPVQNEVFKTGAVTSISQSKDLLDMSNLRDTTVTKQRIIHNKLEDILVKKKVSRVEAILPSKSVIKRAITTSNEMPIMMEATLLTNSEEFPEKKKLSKEVILPLSTALINETSESKTERLKEDDNIRYNSKQTSKSNLKVDISECSHVECEVPSKLLKEITSTFNHCKESVTDTVKSINSDNCDNGTETFSCIKLKSKEADPVPSTSRVVTIQEEDVTKSKSNDLLPTTSVTNKQSVLKTDNLNKIVSSHVLSVPHLSKQPVIQLERLDNKYIQSYFQDVYTSDAFKYTMEDDIVVISDDEDGGTSNYSDNKSKETLDNFNDCELVEDEDQNEFESDSDNEWWPKLSQSFLDEIELEETVSNNRSSLKREVTDDSDSEYPVPKKTMKRHIKPRILSDDESIKDSLTPEMPNKKGDNTGIVSEKKDVPQDKAKDTCKGKSNMEKKNSKQTICPRRTQIIDAQPLLPRRYHRISTETKAPTKVIIDVESTHTSVLPGNFNGERKTKRRRRRSGSGDSDYHKHSLLSTKDKMSITAERKEKLKAIANQKKSEASSTNTLNKVKVKVRVKNTTVSRGDILVEDLIPSKKVNGKVSVSTSNISKKMSPGSHCSRSYGNKTSSVNYISQPVNICVPQSKLIPNIKDNEINTSSKVLKPISVKDLPRIPRIKDQVSSRVNTRTDSAQNKPENLFVTASCSDTRTENELTFAHKSSISITRGTRQAGRRRVHFKSDDLCQIRYIPIEDNAQLHPVALIKDAPLNRNTNHNRPKMILPKSSLEQVINAVCNWNTKWLQEQKELNRPPPCYGQITLCPMLTSFTSYGDYFRIVNPLMLLDLWAKLCQELDRSKNQSRKHPHNIIMESVVEEGTSSYCPLMQLKCHVLLSNYDINTSHVPYVADLCILDVYSNIAPLQSITSVMESDSQGTTQCARMFAFVDSINKEPHITNHNVLWNNDQNNQKIAWKLNMILKVKCNSYVKHNTKLKLTVLANIRPDLRMFEAVSALIHCELSKQILNPVIEDYVLPPMDTSRKLVLKDTLNISQRNAVLQSADACLKSEPKICLIQGPPGTGKSTVITNIIMQILYGKNQYQKNSRKKNRPRILLCAPSNAAVDEAVCRLLEIRQNLIKEDRFKMVRTGRMDMMRPMVQDISLEDLSKRDVRQSLQERDGLESVVVEINNLEAKRRSYEMTLESAEKRQGNTANILNKIKDVDRKLLQLKNISNGKVNPRKQGQMERESQMKLLSGADIVASTLSSCFTALMSEVFLTSGGDTRFTCCIVDEATQCCEPEALVPLMLGIKTFVLVGDPEQLQATVVSMEAQKYGFGQSLFTRIWRKFGHEDLSPVHFLDVQYRMHPEICKWPNEYVYSDRIRSSPMIESVRYSPLMPYVILSLEFKQLANGETVNPKEAKLVSQLALSIQDLSKHNLKVAIITPYQRQRTEILRQLRNSVHTYSNLEVNTIDSFQGQECDVVILSCVRTEGVGFMTDTQRLNVALTRARFSLIICGNFVSLRRDAMWADLLRNASDRSLIVHLNCMEVPSKEGLLRFVLRRS